ncbi:MULTISPECIES: DUF6932 family protein [unclassified Burkholderia]|uniref:DUF6932 family protein n=1 Tax=unclassified Burkholderia TaxID=2613784 RepID=UPI001E56C8EA|nr:MULTISPECIES: hypothetical protein [unclassified Burkholderia]UEP31315.1 hypothetical protein LMA01_19040 [Burkholderia sp. B21-007]UEP43437.1 hypothetical protein LMA02_25585 [Burkholderia sp. B21-005]
MSYNPPREYSEQRTLNERTARPPMRPKNKDHDRGDSSVIPEFNASMVLPPFVGDTPTKRAACSPYVATFSEYVLRFGHSDERREILRGLRTYRAELRANGFVAGYQWLNGSFSENVEATRGRPPGDIDVVTYAYRPTHLLDAQLFGQWCTQNRGLFDTRALKQRLHCEAFFIDLHKPPHLLVDDVRYWSGLFSHQRETFLWKGMVNVPLDSDDNDAVVAGVLG